MELLPLRNLASMQAFIKNTKFNNGCVEWQRMLNIANYGVLRINKKTVMAHRLAWVWANSREIPKGMHMCHSCDNPKCVSPEHLWVGTPTENYNDMVSKGRATIFKGHARNIGGSNPFAKLDEHKVREIRAMLAKKVKRAAIAKIYGINVCSISAIHTGSLWKHVV